MTEEEEKFIKELILSDDKDGRILGYTILDGLMEQEKVMSFIRACAKEEGNSEEIHEMLYLFYKIMK